MMRTHTCGQLRAEDIGKDVCLQGWVRFSRDHGGVEFIDLADRYGITQVVFDPEDLPVGTDAGRLADVIKTFTRESAVCVKGTVRKRVEGTAVASNPTGDVEVLITCAQLYNKCVNPVFEVGDQKEGVLPNEEVRLRYRYLDLRRSDMTRAITFRSRFVHLAREYLESQGFLEIETPMLSKSTPEGARDYVVPSRVHPGTFYALPQSPQLYKQMLMVGGMDRYYQVARCFRDEDSRKDRQPEFTQLDMEMSFVDMKDIQDNIESMMRHVWKGLYGKELATPFPRISYMTAMERYGSDKPDLRYGLPLEKLTDVLVETNYGIFKKIVAEKGIIVGMNLKRSFAGDRVGRNDVDRYIALAKKFGLGGLTWMRAKNGTLDSNIVKYFTDRNIADIKRVMGAEEGDLLFLMAGPWKRTLEGAGLMRRQVASDLGLVPEDEFQFHWLVDCPMFETDPLTGKKDAFHHPFVLPDDDFIGGSSFDLLLNGNELGSGSLRINRPEVQRKVLEMLGMDEDRIERNFGWFIEALSCGAPPHGGIALGIDRLIAILLGKDTIRDVIAFPKNKKAESLTDGSPERIDDEKLEELQIMTLSVDDIDALAEEMEGKEERSFVKSLSSCHFS